MYPTDDFVKALMADAQRRGERHRLVRSVRHRRRHGTRLRRWVLARLRRGPRRRGRVSVGSSDGRRGGPAGSPGSR